MNYEELLKKKNKLEITCLELGEDYGNLLERVKEIVKLLHSMNKSVYFNKLQHNFIYDTNGHIDITIKHSYLYIYVYDANEVLTGVANILLEMVVSDDWEVLIKSMIENKIEEEKNTVDYKVCDICNNKMFSCKLTFKSQNLIEVDGYRCPCGNEIISDHVFEEIEKNIYK